MRPRKTGRAAWLTGLFLLAGAAEATAQNGGPVQTIPIPATTLILLGAGLLVMPWLRSKREK